MAQLIPPLLQSGGEAVFLGVALGLRQCVFPQPGLTAAGLGFTQLLAFWGEFLCFGVSHLWLSHAPQHVVMGMWN